MDRYIIQEAREALSTLESEAHSLGMRVEYRHELAASIRAGLNAADKTTAPTPATTPEAEWVRLSEDQPREIDVDVRLNDGSIIRNCLAQSDGDFYWKGGGSEMFILEHTVIEWRAATPPQEQ